MWNYIRPKVVQTQEHHHFKVIGGAGQKIWDRIRHLSHQLFLLKSEFANFAWKTGPTSFPEFHWLKQVNSHTFNLLLKPGMPINVIYAYVFHYLCYCGKIFQFFDDKYLICLNSPSFFDGMVLFITYFRTSSSLLKLNKRRIFEARFGPRRRGTTRSVKPSISFSPEFFPLVWEHQNVENNHLS